MSDIYNQKRLGNVLPDFKPADEHQVGGTHYQAPKGLQHWDIVIAHDLNYFEAQILRYVMRCRKKNGLQDLYKGQHFIEKYIQDWEQINRLPAVQVQVVPHTVEDVDRDYELQLQAAALFQPDGFGGDGRNGYQCVTCRQVVKAKSPLSAQRIHQCPGGMAGHG